MFAYYGGVAHVTVPDRLKQGVLKCHLYDPDLNPGYADLAGPAGEWVWGRKLGEADLSPRAFRARHRNAYVLTLVSGLVVVVMCSILERGARLAPGRPE
jgi:hypothetical protein